MWVRFMNEIEKNKIDENVEKVQSRVERRENGYVNTDSLVNVVSELTDTSISFDYISFSRLSKNVGEVQDLGDFGAMMLVTKGNDGKRKANIYLNSDKEVKFRRFSLAHELGHLMNEQFDNPKAKYVVSTHIQYNLTSLPDSTCEDPFFNKEQLANIFALKVLIPGDELHRLVKQNVDLETIGRRFGVDVDAVYSRLQLGT